MLLTLVVKDLLRARRNPIAFVVQLAVPLLIIALLGLAFGGAGKGGGLGRIRMGIVDEDDSSISRFLRGAINQGEGAKYLEAIFVSREEAQRQISENRLSAIVILPKGFAMDYLHGRRQVALELIKNPAQSFYPVIVEELLGAVTTTLNALDRSFRPELAEWQMLMERPTRPLPREIAELVARTGDRMEAYKDYLFPPLVTYRKDSAQARSSRPSDDPAGNPESARPKAGKPAFNIFAYVLPGMAGMFLLFVADQALRDLYRERRFRTLPRLRTMHEGVYVFVASKVVFAFVMVLMGCLILFGGGGWVFGIRWEHPVSLVCLCAGYALFAAGFMALVTALAGTEKRADTINTLAGMVMGLAAGCMFPREQLPAVLSQHVTPWMPPYWFAAAARSLQTSEAAGSWVGSTLLLAALGLALVAAAGWMLRARVEQEPGP